MVVPPPSPRPPFQSEYRTKEEFDAAERAYQQRLAQWRNDRNTEMAVMIVLGFAIAGGGIGFILWLIYMMEGIRGLLWAASICGLFWVAVEQVRRRL